MKNMISLAGFNMIYGKMIYW